MDRETATVVLVIICLLAGLVVAQPLFPSNNQPFSELGTLGPQKTIQGYPKSVVLNQSFLLYGYIGNHEGVVDYYEMSVKLGNSSTIITNTTSANAPIIATYYYILSDGQNTTFPINIAINQMGTNLRLIFELWSYNQAASSFAYTGLWNQLWINVTAI
jgi:uncharacterized membrane protein